MRILLVKWAAIALVLIFIGSYLYISGTNKGSNTVQSLWDKATLEQNKQTSKLKEEYSLLADKHRLVNQGINDALSKASKEHAVAVVELRNGYASRLRSSEARSNLYKRQADAGPIECQRLGSHATELDRSIEEGRYLVRELSETIRLRDEQVIMLGKQINNDRAVLIDSGK